MSESSEGSATHTPTKRSVLATRPPTPNEFIFAAVMKGLSGDWVGDQHETYKVKCSEDMAWTCVMGGSVFSLPVALACDFNSNAVWWGSDKHYFLDIAELFQCPARVTWRPCGNARERGPKFVWHRPYTNVPKAQDSNINPQYSAGSCGVNKIPNTKNQPPALGVHANGANDIADKAVLEIEEQLYAPGYDGFVWVYKWNERYLRRLGTLRSFLESHPNKFRVIPGRGKGYSVAAAGSSSDIKDRSSLS